VSIPADVLLLNTYTDLWRGRVGVTNPLDERLVGAADIWIPVTPMYDDWFYVSPGGYPGYAAYAERRRLGEELWFYVCNANFPPFLGYDVDARLGYEPRLVKWGAYREGATGFLFWRVNYWQDPEPWAVLANYVEFGNLFARQGDGILFYPGDHDGTAGGAGSPPEVAMDGPALSYRMKMIRDGLEDWELFRMTEEQGGGPWVRTQIARAPTGASAHGSAQVTTTRRTHPGPWTTRSCTTPGDRSRPSCCTCSTPSSTWIRRAAIRPTPKTAACRMVVRMRGRARTPGRTRARPRTAGPMEAPRPTSASPWTAGSPTRPIRMPALTSALRSRMPTR